MDYLKIKEADLVRLGGIDTAKEICGQPELWLKVYQSLVDQRKPMGNFLNETLVTTKKIILTGAGTSAYIGLSIEGFVQRHTGITTVSVPTTHLVSHPQDYFEADVPTILFSFARSGNSPESVAAVKLADQHCENCIHLIITCNADGSLANYNTKGKRMVFLLPPEANDKSLAMTGSYSGMLLSALLLGNYGAILEMESTINRVAKYGNVLLSQKTTLIKKIAELPYKRAVFLGSGPQFGTAMEAHLKLQELTDGAIVCKNDSYLGFRHGPKAVVDEHTLLVYFFSNKEEVLRYERDLLDSMQNGKRPLAQIGVCAKELDIKTLDDLIVLDNKVDNAAPIDEAYLSVVTVLLGQLIGFYKSLELGLQPDAPSASGAISRVVKGVVIY
ncbi:SIS domain-containing protein [Allomuricauda sp. AC10]|nr:SIS domain-containing protein [Muricauda sp. AC10]